MEYMFESCFLCLVRDGVFNLCGLWIAIDHFVNIPVGAASRFPLTSQRGQATLCSLIGPRLSPRRATWAQTAEAGNQQPDLERPIGPLHVASSKSPINWSDCPADREGELRVSVFVACLLARCLSTYNSQLMSLLLILESQSNFISHHFHRETICLIRHNR